MSIEPDVQSEDCWETHLCTCACVRLSSNMCVCVCLIPLEQLSELERSLLTLQIWPRLISMWFLGVLKPMFVPLTHSLTHFPHSFTHGASAMPFLKMLIVGDTVAVISSCSSTQAATRGVSLSVGAGQDSGAVRASPFDFSTLHHTSEEFTGRLLLEIFAKINFKEYVCVFFSPSPIIFSHF